MRAAKRQLSGRTGDAHGLGRYDRKHRRLGRIKRRADKQVACCVHKAIPKIWAASIALRVRSGILDPSEVKNCDLSPILIAWLHGYAILDPAVDGFGADVASPVGDD